MPITQEKYAALPVGTKLKVTSNTCGHGYGIGEVYVTYRRSGRHWELAAVDMPTMGLGSYITNGEVELVNTTRNEKIRDLKKKQQEAEEKLLKITHELEVITKYKNELDELAAALFSRLAEAKDKKLTPAILYKALQELGVDEHVVRKPNTEKKAA